MEQETKYYVIEDDVIAISGSEAIQRLSSEGNTVYVDLQNLLEKASNEKNPNQMEYLDAIKYIRTGKVTCDGEINLDNSGKVILNTENVNGGATHITRDETVKLQLDLENKKHETPQFLVYGADIFNESIIDINQTNKGELSVYSIEDKLGYSLTNNQILRINGNRFAKVRKDLLGRKETGRFSIDESSEGRIEFFDPSKNLGTTIDVVPRNLEQKVALHQLKDRDIEVFVMSGGSGSGKTVLCYAMALERILGPKGCRENEGIILFKTNDIIGGKSRNLGFYPGTIHEKTEQDMKSYSDAHNILGLNEYLSFTEMLQHPKYATKDFAERQKGRNKIKEAYIPSRNAAIEIEHLQHARGRTFERKIIFVDEAQNYTPFEIKQLLERVGIGSTVFIVGDSEQIDNEKLDRNFNGLTYAAKILHRNHPRSALISLDKNYRSQTAEIMRNNRAPNL